MILFFILSSLFPGPEPLFSNKSNETEEDICFPLELVDFIFHLIFGSGYLKSVDQVSTEKLHLMPNLRFKGFSVVFVGSYINRMLPNSYSGKDYSFVNTIFNKKKVTQSNFKMSCLYIPEGIAVYENKIDAGKFDLFVDGVVSNGPFKLVPKRPKIWDLNMLKENSECYVTHIKADTLNDIYNFVEKRAKLTKEFRSTFAISVKWPGCAMEWIGRNRPSGILNDSIIKTIAKTGCHAVPYLCPDSSKTIFVETLEDDTLWTLSFDVAEKEFSKLLTQNQRNCFMLFRCLFDKSVIGHQIPNQTLIHLFFYACDNIPRIEWERRPGMCFLVLTKRLFYGFQSKFLPHYFVKTKNLLGTLSTQTGNEICNQLSRHFSNPLWSICKALDVCNITQSDISPLVDDICRVTVQYSLCCSKRPAIYSCLSSVACFHMAGMAASGHYQSVVPLVTAFFCAERSETVPTLLMDAGKAMFTYELWNLCVCLDISLGTKFTHKLFTSTDCIHISKVFGESAADLIIDVCLPDEASVVFGELMYPLTLGLILENIAGKSCALIPCIKFYLREYIRLAGDDLTLAVVNDSNMMGHAKHDFPFDLTLEYVFRLHALLFSTCMRHSRPEEYREFLPHLEKITAELKTDFHEKSFQRVANMFLYKP